MVSEPSIKSVGRNCWGCVFLSAFVCPPQRQPPVTTEKGGLQAPGCWSSGRWGREPSSRLLSRRPPCTSPSPATRSVCGGVWGLPVLLAPWHGSLLAQPCGWWPLGGGWLPQRTSLTVPLWLLSCPSAGTPPLPTSRRMRTLVTFLVVSALVSVALASCPNACSGHGDCKVRVWGGAPKVSAAARPFSFLFSSPPPPPHLLLRAGPLPPSLPSPHPCASSVYYQCAVVARCLGLDGGRGTGEAPRTPFLSHLFFSFGRWAPLSQYLSLLYPPVHSPSSSLPLECVVV